MRPSGFLHEKIIGDLPVDLDNDYWLGALQQDCFE